MRLLPAGADALLVEVETVQQATALYAAARSAGLEVVDLVPAARSVLFDGVNDLAGLRAFLDTVELDSALEQGPDARGDRRRGTAPVVVPTTYDGADLDDVARLWDMTRAEVVATHTGTAFTVAFCGFAPGFAYCTGLPERLAVPRLDRPRSRVPAGSVGLAGAFTGVYPRCSPGGWRLVGRTRLTLWDVEAPDPALLAPGTPVRFEQVRP